MSAASPAAAAAADTEPHGAGAVSATGTTCPAGRAAAGMCQHVASTGPIADPVTTP